MWDKVPALDNAAAQETILHAWKAGPQTVALRRQLEAMPDGGVYALSIPVAPYRCPPGPYERACQVAWYFKRAKPKSKVLVLDGNGDVTSKGPLFKKAWAEEYQGIVEYRPNYVLTDVDVASRTAKFDVQDSVRASVLNVIPPQRASAIARTAGVVTANDRWCDVDFVTFESVKVKNVHVLGDCDPARDRHAQVGSHGEPACEGLRGGGRRAALRPGAESGAGPQQYVLQLHHGQGRRARVLGPPVRRGEENRVARAGLGRSVIGDERARRPVRVELGEEHLGRHARLRSSGGAQQAQTVSWERGEQRKFAVSDRMCRSGSDRDARQRKYRSMIVA